MEAAEKLALVDRRAATIGPMGSVMYVAVLGLSFTARSNAMAVPSDDGSALGSGPHTSLTTDVQDF